MKNLQKLTLTLIACTSVFGFSMAALADDDQPSPAPNSSVMPEQGMERSMPNPNADADIDSLRAHQLEERYGHDRDIATPPLIVKQSLVAGKLEAKAIQMSHPGSPVAAVPQSLPRLANTRISMTSKQTVVSKIKPADFESPATEFVNFVYVLMAGLGLMVLFLAFGLGFRKGKLKR